MLVAVCRYSIGSACVNFEWVAGSSRATLLDEADPNNIPITMFEPAPLHAVEGNGDKGNISKQIIMAVFGKILSTREKSWNDQATLEVTMINHEGETCTVYSSIDEHSEKLRDLAAHALEDQIVAISDVRASATGRLYINRL